ncbi:hypothetical protein V6N13_079549 [Hibiscus sabdariffa]
MPAHILMEVMPAHMPDHISARVNTISARVVSYVVTGLLEYTILIKHLQQLFKVLIKSPSLGVAPSTQEHHGPYGFFGIVVQASSLDVFRDWNPMPSLNSILSHDIHGRLAHLLKLFSDRPLRFVVTGEALRLHICFKSMPLFCDFRVRY